MQNSISLLEFLISLSPDVIFFKFIFIPYSSNEGGGGVKLWDQEMKRCKAFDVTGTVVKSVARSKVPSFLFLMTCNSFCLCYIRISLIYRRLVHLLHWYRCGGLGFDSKASQIRHSVANGSPPLRRFLRAVLPRR